MNRADIKCFLNFTAPIPAAHLRGAGFMHWCYLCMELLDLDHQYLGFKCLLLVGWRLCGAKISCCYWLLNFSDRFAALGRISIGVLALPTSTYFGWDYFWRMLP